MAIPWILVMTVYLSYTNDGFQWGFLALTSLVAVPMHLLFIVGMEKVIHWSGKKLYDKIIVPIPTGDRLIKEAGANHFRGLEGVGGKLTLTDKRLIFKSHSYNLQNHTQTFDLNQVLAVAPCKIWKVYNTGLEVTLSNQEVHRFSVQNRNEWLREIGKLQEKEVSG